MTNSDRPMDRFHDEQLVLGSIFGEDLEVVTEQFFCIHWNEKSVLVDIQWPVSTDAMVPKVIIKDPRHPWRDLSAVEGTVNAEIERLGGENAVYSALQLIPDLEEESSSLLHPSTVDNSENPLQGEWSCLLVRLDHMRDSNHYSRLLRDWCCSLSLHGHLFYRTNEHLGDVLHNLYLYFEASEEASLQQLLRKWRTECVDVDRDRRPCKERLLHILLPIQPIPPAPQHTLSTSTWTIATYASQPALIAQIQEVNAAVAERLSLSLSVLN